MKITNIAKSFWNNYLMRPLVLVPNIHFLRFNIVISVLTGLAIIHTYPRWQQLGQNRSFISLFHIFITIEVPNILSVIVGLFFIKILNAKYPRNDIPARHIIVLFAAIGGLRGILLEFLQRRLEVDQPYQFFLKFKNFGIPIDIGDIVNGIALGTAISLLIIYYSIFCDSELKIHQKINRERRELHQEINEIESQLAHIENGVEEKIYQEILDKINLKSLLRNINKKSTAADLQNLLRSELPRKLRSLSSELLDTKEPKFRRKQILSALDFINTTPLILRPGWFVVSSIVMTVGNNASLNLNTNIEFTLANCSLSALILYLFKRFFCVHLEKHCTNFNLTLMITIVLAFTSHILGLITSYGPGFEFQIQRFIFFFSLITLLSFIATMHNAEKDAAKDKESIFDLAQKLEYLKNTLETMEREISEHLHGYLIFQLHELAGMTKDIVISEESLKDLQSRLVDRFSYQNYSMLTKNFILETPSLDRLANEWSTLMEVRFTGDIDQLDLLPRAQSREAWNVIIELIINAYRHGAASKIDIDFDFRKKGFLKILAVNDGSQVPSNHGKGSGSSIINVASDGNWSIANNKKSGVAVNVQIEFYGADRTTQKQLGRI